MKRIVTLLSALLPACLLTGCGDKLLVATPTVTLDGVEIVDRTPEGARALIHLTLTNDGDVPLPLTDANYSLTLANATYSGGTNPNATLPAKGSQSITLPAAVAGSPADVPNGCSYTLSGSLHYEPPGQIRQVLTDIGVPLPSVGFNGNGNTTGSPQVRPVLENKPAPGSESPAPQAEAERSAASGSPEPPATPAPGSSESSSPQTRNPQPETPSPAQ
ncbi:MAG: hypothetical protein ACYC26_13680 [Phycisphaerales bacterium]